MAPLHMYVSLASAALANWITLDTCHESSQHVMWIPLVGSLPLLSLIERCYE